MESLKSRILNYFERYDSQYPGAWQNGGEIERLSLEIGYKASNASRRCRELVTEGYIERRERNGSVEYRVAQQNEQIVLKTDLLQEMLKGPMENLQYDINK